MNSSLKGREDRTSLTIFTHPTSTQLQQYVNVIRVFEESVKADDVLVGFRMESFFLPHGVMNSDLHRHLKEFEKGIK